MVRSRDRAERYSATKGRDRALRPELAALEQMNVVGYLPDHGVDSGPSSQEPSDARWALEAAQRGESLSDAQGSALPKGASIIPRSGTTRRKTSIVVRWTGRCRCRGRVGMCRNRAWCSADHTAAARPARTARGRRCVAAIRRKAGRFIGIPTRNVASVCGPAGTRTWAGSGISVAAKRWNRGSDCSRAA